MMEDRRSEPASNLQSFLINPRLLGDTLIEPICQVVSDERDLQAKQEEADRYTHMFTASGLGVIQRLRKHLDRPEHDKGCGCHRQDGAQEEGNADGYPFPSGLSK
jgi:hypothetical protein